MQFGLPVDSRLQLGAQLQQQQCDEHEHEHRFPPPHSNIVMTAQITICAAWNRKI
nr:MAG TPA: hypothetical protein [Caudoviricetes sp.]